MPYTTGLGCLWLIFTQYTDPSLIALVCRRHESDILMIYMAVRATVNVYEPKVKKDSEDLSQTGIQINNRPKGQIDGIVVCYSVAPGHGGDRFSRFHVVWVSRNISWINIMVSIIKYKVKSKSKFIYCFLTFK
jgi:hypothetical protein